MKPLPVPSVRAVTSRLKQLKRGTNWSGVIAIIVRLEVQRDGTWQVINVSGNRCDITNPGYFRGSANFTKSANCDDMARLLIDRVLQHYATT